jgi:hypothetical protein
MFLSQVYGGCSKRDYPHKEEVIQMKPNKNTYADKFYHKDMKSGGVFSDDFVEVITQAKKEKPARKFVPMDKYFE